MFYVSYRFFRGCKRQLKKKNYNILKNWLANILRMIFVNRNIRVLKIEWIKLWYLVQAPHILSQLTTQQFLYFLIGKTFHEVSHATFGLIWLKQAARITNNMERKHIFLLLLLG